MPTQQQINAVNQSDILSDEDYQELIARSQGYPGFAPQRQGISNLKEQLKNYLDQPNQVDLSPLMALADQWSGSKLAGSYKTPVSGEERAINTSKLQGAIQQAEAGLSDDQLKLLQAQLSAQYNKQLKEMALDQRNRELATKPVEPTPFEKKRDENFASKWDDYQNAGGRGSLQTSLQAFDDAIAELENNPDLVGTTKIKIGTTIAPDKLSQIAPKTAALKQKVARGILGGFKGVFGGNPTEGERKAYYETVIDENLNAQQNIDKLRSARKEYEGRGLSIEKAGQYATKNRGLKEYGAGDALVTTPVAPPADPNAVYKAELLRRQQAKTAGGKP